LAELPLALKELPAPAPASSFLYNNTRPNHFTLQLQSKPITPSPHYIFYTHTYTHAYTNPTAIMTRADTEQVKVHYKGNEDDFVIMAESVEAVKRWKEDKSTPLVDVVNSFDVFTTHKYVNPALPI
jgi:hypothetical protein